MELNNEKGVKNEGFVPANNLANDRKDIKPSKMRAAYPNEKQINDSIEKYEKGKSGYDRD